jgi:hypothetical protein
VTVIENLRHHTRPGGGGADATGRELLASSAQDEWIRRGWVEDKRRRGKRGKKKSGKVKKEKDSLDILQPQSNK